MKIPVLILLGLTVPLAVLPLRAASLDEANAAFVAGRYEESTKGYQAVIDEKGYAAPVLYNLGNSYFREGNLPQAILAYKRAQWLAPDDQDIAANLQYAQKQAGVTVAEPGWWEKYTGFFSPSTWAWLASAAWALMCFYNFAWWLWPKARGGIALPGLACVVLLVISIASIMVTAGKMNQGVVVAKNASLLVSPFAAAQSVFSPAPGETLKVCRTYHGFLLVTDDAGHKGWIDQAQLSPVVKD